MLLVRIKQLRGRDNEWSHYFYDVVFNSKTLAKLSQFFAKKAKGVARDIDITWDYEAYKFAESMVLRFKETGVKHTLDWLLEIQNVPLETL